MALIDIVIPVYNQSDKIFRCLKSLQNQTFQDFKITIVDDGSTDGVFEKLHSWMRAENLRATDVKSEISTKTKIIRQAHSGASSARNHGAKEGNAPYLLFCDADITLNKTFLKKTLQTLTTNPKPSYSYTSFKYGWKKFKLWEFNPHKLKEMPYIHTTSLIRREHFVGFDETLKRFQDWDMWLTMLERGYFGVHLPQILFTVHPGGTMSRWIPKFFIHYLTKTKRVRSYLEAMKRVKEKHHFI